MSPSCINQCNVFPVEFVDSRLLNVVDRLPKVVEYHCKPGREERRKAIDYVSI
jgi:hypothetical protein